MSGFEITAKIADGKIKTRYTSEHMLRVLPVSQLSYSGHWLMLIDNGCL